MDKNRFPQFLADLMEEKSLTPTGLASRVGKSYETVRKWMAGAFTPTGQTQFDLFAMASPELARRYGFKAHPKAGAAPDTIEALARKVIDLEARLERVESRMAPRQKKVG